MKYYQISEGSDYYVTKESEIFRLKNGKYKKLKTSSNYGYKVFVEYRRDGTRVRHRVHRVVATLFIPNPENKKEVNHKDFDRSNNKISNLEWMTKAENVKHAKEGGRYKNVGKAKSSRRKLIDEQVLEIRKRHSNGSSVRSMRNDYGVSQDVINKVVKRITYTNI